MAKKRAGMTTPPPPPTGVEAAKQFFDLAEDEISGGGLRNAIGYNNEQIIALAKAFGYVFDYDEMQEHLIARFGCKTPSKFKYCCT
jgi:hypothetical protein